MAVIGNTYQNIRSTEEGASGDVIELLMRLNPMLDDMVAVECNNGTSHLTSMRTGLPTGAWGRLYKGIPQSQGSYQQVEDTTGFYEARSSVDSRLLELEPEKAGQTRLNEAQGHLQDMNNEMGTGLFYHDTATTPEKFKGLASRYGQLTGGGAAGQIIDGGGVQADNTSIWFVTWSETATHVIYPKGIPAGIQRQDKGEQRILDASGDAYYAQEEIFRWHMGLTVRDWRMNSRVANIDVSNVLAGTVDLYGLMRRAYYKLWTRDRRRDAVDGIGPMRQAIYMNRDMLSALDALATNKGASDSYIRLTPAEIEGKEIMTWRGIPIRETDSILNTEAQVV